MIKYWISLTAIISNHQAICQHFYMTPFMGNAVTVASNDESLRGANTPNSDFQFEYPKMNYSKFAPLTFGVRFEYEIIKSRFASGIIFGDETGSSFHSGIISQYPNSPLTNNLTFALNGGYVGRFLTKIPISYDYKLCTTHHIGNKKKFLSINIHTGFNLFFIKKWTTASFDNMEKFDVAGQDGWLIQPYSYSYNTVDGNVASFDSYECNLQKGWSISMDLGLGIDWYIKNSRRITTMIYYEQGTKNVSALVNKIYFNGVFQGYNAAYSRGSGIHLKICFPIEFFKNHSSEIEP